MQATAKNNSAQEKKETSWDVDKLILNLSIGTPMQILLLLVARHHINTRKGYAWMEQKHLAEEMHCDERTVRRCFAWSKRNDLLIVRLVKTGKLPSDQHNEYWLNVERLKEFQRPAKKPEHRTPVSYDTQPEHRTNATASQDTSAGNIGQIRQGTQDTSVLRVFEVAVSEEAGNEKAVESVPVVNSCSGPANQTATTGSLSQEQLPKPNSKPDWLQQADTQQISRAECMNFHEHARVRGWTPKQRKTFLRETYGVDNVKKLSALQYHAALALLHRCTWNVWYHQMVNAKMGSVN